MAVVQEVVVEGSDAIVMAEPGAAFVWTSHALRFHAPGRFRMSARFGSMGQFTAGVVGAARAQGRAVAIVGDGAMLMQNEVSTAVSMRAACVWVVLNDGRYGLVDDGMRANGFPACDLAIPPVDFAAQAVAVGALGLRVETEGQIEEAVREALAARGPVVIDVWIDATERAPLGARNASLNAQAAGGDGLTVCEGLDSEEEL
jgi:acetolactate synthase-1/2/3 large subunit